MVDAHTIATFAFAQLRRDPSFGPRFPWVRNTIVCVESDLASDVLSNMAAHHFPQGCTIACYYPTEHRFMFIRVDGPHKAGTHKAEPRGGDVARDTYGEITIGMLVDSIYSSQKDWDLAKLSSDQMVGEVSTVEVEKALALR
jgi:hypothetical protein